MSFIVAGSPKTARMHILYKRESHAFAGEPRDAAVNFDTYRIFKKVKKVKGVYSC